MVIQFEIFNSLAKKLLALWRQMRRYAIAFRYFCFSHFSLYENLKFVVSLVLGVMVPFGFGGHRYPEMCMGLGGGGTPHELQREHIHTATFIHRRACRQEQSTRTAVALAVDERPFNPKPTVSSEFNVSRVQDDDALPSVVLRFYLSLTVAIRMS
jgi:hypothetical protein